MAEGAGAPPPPPAAAPDDGSSSSLLQLPQIHAAKATFPPSCPVLVRGIRDGEESARLGAVTKVFLDMDPTKSTHGQIYEVEACTDADGNGGGASEKEKLIVPGERLRFGPGAPVRCCAEKVAVGAPPGAEATVRSCYRAPAVVEEGVDDASGEGVVLYTVESEAPDGKGIVLYHSIDSRSLKFRHIEKAQQRNPWDAPAALGGVVESRSPIESNVSGRPTKEGGEMPKEASAEFAAEGVTAEKSDESDVKKETPAETKLEDAAAKTGEGMPLPVKSSEETTATKYFKHSNPVETQSEEIHENEKKPPAGTSAPATKEEGSTARGTVPSQPTASGGGIQPGEIMERIDVPDFVDQKPAASSLVHEHSQLIHRESRCRVMVHGCGFETRKHFPGKGDLNGPLCVVLVALDKRDLERAKKMVFDYLAKCLERQYPPGPDRQSLQDDLALACNLATSEVPGAGLFGTGTNIDCGPYGEPLPNQQRGGDEGRIRHGAGFPPPPPPPPRDSGEFHSSGRKRHRSRSPVPGDERRVLPPPLGREPFGRSCSWRVFLPPWMGDVERTADRFAGDRGKTIDFLRAEYGCDVSIEGGRGMDPRRPHVREDAHILIRGESDASVDRARFAVEKILLGLVDEKRRWRLRYDLAAAAVEGRSGSFAERSGHRAVGTWTCDGRGLDRGWLCFVPSRLSRGELRDRILVDRGRHHKELERRTGCRIKVCTDVDCSVALFSPSSARAAEGAAQVVQAILYDRLTAQSALQKFGF